MNRSALEQRAWNLRAVPAAFRRPMVEWIRHIADPAELAVYDARCLHLLTTFVEPLTDSDFVSLCATHSNVEDPHELARAFGVSDAMHPKSWRNLGQSSEGRPAHCLYAMTQCLVMGTNPPPIVGIADVYLFMSRSIGMLGAPDRAAALMEELLGIGPGEYADEALLIGKLQESLDGWGANMRAAFVQTLASSLRVCGRNVDGIAVLFANLGVSQEVEANKLLAALRAPASTIAPKTRLSYLTQLAEALEVEGRRDTQMAVLEATTHI